MKKIASSTSMFLSDLALRLSLFIVFFAGAYEQLFIKGVSSFSLANGLPVFVGYVTIIAEFLAAIGIMLGLFLFSKDQKGVITRVSGALISVIMLGAIIMLKWTILEKNIFVGINSMQTEIPLLALGLYYLIIGNRSTS
jgi:uncharacterized membrane protein YphA (DoxX/SURF4 family)